MAFFKAAAQAPMVPIVLAGGINGVIEASYSMALGAIVFSGPLQDYLPIGLGLGLFTTIAIATATALTSSLPGVIGGVQDVPAILLSLVLGTVLVQAAATEVLPTAIATIAVTTLSVGLVSLVLGVFKLGNIIRFVPFPIIGGFLGGTGWFIVLGSLLLMTGLPDLAAPELLMQPRALVQWLPGLVFAVAHLLLLPRHDHPLLLPALIFGSLPLFYLALGVTGTSLSEAGDLGLLLGPFSGDGRWHPLQLAALADARWDLILGQWQSIGVLLAVTLMAVLLNVSSLEVVLKEEMNLNQELRATGIANLVSGLGGGLVGFHGLGSSVLGFDAIGARSRWVGVLVALCAAVPLVFGAEVVGVFPRFVLGGLGLSLGFSFLEEWLWKARRGLLRVDYAIVVAIVLTMATLGVLPGVGLGLAIAIATFLINYSRINVVRHRVSGCARRSPIDRAPHEQQALQEMGNQIQILELQGYLFFGTANHLIGQIRRQAADLKPELPQFIVLDFAQVTGMDSSAAYSFMKLKQATKPPLRLVITHLRPALRDLLQRQGCLESEDLVFHLAPDLDRGLEWCETQLLETLSWRRRRYVPLPLQLQKLFADPDHIAPFMEHLEKLQLPASATLFEPGEAAHQLYFLESGQISTVTTTPNGDQRWEHTYKPGTVIGAIAFYTQSTYPVWAYADQPSTVYRLTYKQYQAMAAHHLPTAATFQSMMLRHLAEQLRRADTDLQSLLP
jgi:SulP family sulfate permease